jgi:hypothetical protein
MGNGEGGLKKEFPLWWYRIKKREHPALHESFTLMEYRYYVQEMGLSP